MCELESFFFFFFVTILPFEKPKPPSLVSLCLRVVEKHFEDIIVVLGDIAASFPADIKVYLSIPSDIEYKIFCFDDFDSLIFQL